jgi:hypothetical protein
VVFKEIKLYLPGKYNKIEKGFGQETAKKGLVTT